MAFRLHLRSLSVTLYRRLFSTSDALPSGKDKSRTALSLIRFEQDPQRILDICRSISLSPDSHLDRLVHSKAVSRLRDANHHDAIRSFINDSMDKLECKSERSASHFIILYGQGGLIRDAVKLFDEMPDLGIGRNVKTLNSLLFSCDLAGEYGEMGRIFREFPNKYGLEPNLETYNAVLKGFCRSGRAGEAPGILAEMERKGVKPNTTSFATIIDGFYMEEKYSDVGRMMALMKKHSIEPGIIIYNVRIHSLCKAKRSVEAKALLDGIVAKGMKPNQTTYGHLVYGFCREGKLDTAKAMFKEMIDKEMEPTAECCFTLVYYLCQGRDFDTALGVCRMSMGKGWAPNATTMKGLVDGLVSIGKLREAREIIGQVKEKFSRNAMWAEIEEGLPK